MKDWFATKPIFKIPRRHGKLWQSVYDWMQEGAPGGTLKVMVLSETQADNVRKQFSFLNEMIVPVVCGKKRAT